MTVKKLSFDSLAECLQDAARQHKSGYLVAYRVIMKNQQNFNQTYFVHRRYDSEYDSLHNANFPYYYVSHSKVWKGDCNDLEFTLTAYRE